MKRNKKNLLESNIVYITNILSQIPSIEGITLIMFKGVKKIECSIMCIQNQDNITDQDLQNSFGIRNKRFEETTGVRTTIKVVSSKDLKETVDHFNAMTLKEFVNGEILFDRNRRLIPLQETLNLTRKNDLGEYTEQIDLEKAKLALTI